MDRPGRLALRSQRASSPLRPASTLSALTAIYAANAEGVAKRVRREADFLADALTDLAEVLELTGRQEHSERAAADALVLYERKRMTASARRMDSRRLMR